MLKVSAAKAWSLLCLSFSLFTFECQWPVGAEPLATCGPESEDSSSMAARPEQPDTGDTGQTGTAEKVSYFIVKLEASFTHFVCCRSME